VAGIVYCSEKRGEHSIVELLWSLRISRPAVVHGHGVGVDMPFGSTSVILLGMHVLSAVCTVVNRQTSEAVLGISPGLDSDRRARVFENY